MKFKNGENCEHDLSEAFFGTSTVGERGQIVIPAEARAEIGFAPGDKVLIMRHPIHKGLMVFKLDAVKEFLDDFAQQIEKLERETSKDESKTGRKAK